MSWPRRRSYACKPCGYWCIIWTHDSKKCPKCFKRMYRTTLIEKDK